MKDKCAFKIINGFRQTAGRITSNKSSFPSGLAPGGNHMLHQLVGDATENNLPLLLEVFEKRLNVLIEDRTRIGRELHNVVLQALYTIGVSLETHRRTCPDVSAGAKCSGDQSIEQLNQLIQDIRRMIRGLEEGRVQEFDLMSEMESMIKTYQRLGQLHIELIIQSRALDLLTQEEERELCNITREALGNCVRHAQATRATITLNHSRARIRLAIVDNGIGFSPTKNQSPGYGLPNMEARARKLGGRLHVRSQKGRGTRIIAEFALEPILDPV